MAKQIKTHDIDRVVSIDDYIDSLPITLNKKNLLKLTYKSKEFKTFSNWKLIIKL